MKFTTQVIRHPSILGVALGDPELPQTYSGVPCHLFSEFRRMGCLAGVADSYKIKPTDIFRGACDFGRSLRALRPKHNALWRYSCGGMEVLSARFQRLQKMLPPHDVVFQIGVGALPTDDVKLAAHVEISVDTAIHTEEFAHNYGFAGHSPRDVAEAIKGERYFLQRCDLIWTNSNWTAEGLMKQGVNASRIRVYPPAAGITVAEITPRDWSKCNILFVGVDWRRKGGELLLEAFAKVRQANKHAILTIVGCKPAINVDGVNVMGYLRKDRPQELRTLERLYRESTIFCMPSHWESTGIVYMEAALWGLPVVMLKGQGREDIFPESMAIQIEQGTAKALAEAMIELSRSPDTMEKMGKAGRAMVLEKYTWEKVAETLYNDIQKI